MQKARNVILNFFKGAFIGVGAIIPGVSGGTAAIIVGAFEDLMEATANLFKHIGKSLLILFPTVLGALISMVAVSKPIETFMTSYPTVSNYIFSALTIAGCILFAKKSLEPKFTYSKAISLICGVVAASLIALSKNTLILNFENSGILALLFFGLPLSLALVLPAISFSYMLLFFGLYEKTLNAISAFNLKFLIPLGLGIISGVFIFSKLFIKLTENHSQEVYAFIFGFVLCSVVEIII